VDHTLIISSSPNGKDFVIHTSSVSVACGHVFFVTCHQSLRPNVCKVAERKKA
jgi:hypothetical protein